MEETVTSRRYEGGFREPTELLFLNVILSTRLLCWIFPSILLSWATNCFISNGVVSFLTKVNYGKAHFGRIRKLDTMEWRVAKSAW